MFKLGNLEVTRREAELIVSALLQLWRSKEQTALLGVFTIFTAVQTSEDEAPAISISVVDATVAFLAEVKLAYREKARQYRIYPEVAAVCRQVLDYVAYFFSKGRKDVVVGEFAMWVSVLEEHRSQLPPEARVPIVDTIIQLALPAEQN